MSILSASLRWLLTYGPGPAPWLAYTSTWSDRTRVTVSAVVAVVTCWTIVGVYLC